MRPQALTKRGRWAAERAEMRQLVGHGAPEIGASGGAGEKYVFSEVVIKQQGGLLGVAFHFMGWRAEMASSRRGRSIFRD